MSDREKALDCVLKWTTDKHVSVTPHQNIEREDQVILVDIIAEFLRTAREEGRREGMEEAAKLCETHREEECTEEDTQNHDNNYCALCCTARAIRSQKEVG